MELRRWAPCIDRLATTPDEASALLADAVAVLRARAAWMASTGRRVWEPSPQMPALRTLLRAPLAAAVRQLRCPAEASRADREASVAR